MTASDLLFPAPTTDRAFRQSQEAVGAERPARDEPSGFRGELDRAARPPADARGAVAERTSGDRADPRPDQPAETTRDPSTASDVPAPASEPAGDAAVNATESTATLSTVTTQADETLALVVTEADELVATFAGLSQTLRDAASVPVEQALAVESPTPGAVADLLVAETVAPALVTALGASGTPPIAADLAPAAVLVPFADRPPHATAGLTTTTTVTAASQAGQGVASASGSLVRAGADPNGQSSAAATTETGGAPPIELATPPAVPSRLAVEPGGLPAGASTSNVPPAPPESSETTRVADGVARPVNPAAAPAANGIDLPTGDTGSRPPAGPAAAGTTGTLGAGLGSASLDGAADIDTLNAKRLSRALNSAVKQNGGGLTLRLTPPELGTVRINLQLQGASVSADFVAENEAGGRLLGRQLAQLRTALESQGLTVDRLGVQTKTAAFAGGSGPQSDSQSSRDDNASGQNRSDTADARDGQSRGRERGDAEAQARRDARANPDASGSNTTFRERLVAGA